jgi:hypothetical protein
LDDILRHRGTTLPPPFIVGDGSSQNTVTVVKTIPCGCNSHAVRKFKDCRDAFPEETTKVLAVYGEIFKLEAKLQSDGASPADRLAMHRLTSMPLLNLLCRDGQALFDNKAVEPNSELGAAYNYLLNQQRPLMAFTRYEGIPLTNNEDERTIKMIVLVRKNSQNFTTSVGADIADIIWTCGATALRSGDSLSAYFSHVLRHRRLARQMPELFLPWSWREHKSTVESTVSKTTSAPRAAPSPRSVPKDLVLQ